MLKTTKYNFYIISSLLAFIVCIVWLAIGESIVDKFFEKINRNIIYAFVSGTVFTIAIYGVYALIRLIRLYMDFAADKETTLMTIYNGMMLEEGEGIYFKDKKGYYRLINDAARKLFGIEDKDIIGYRDHAIYDPVMAHKIENEDKRILQTGESMIWEVEKNTGNGNETWLCKKILCKTPNGKALGISGYCRNITILKVLQNLNESIEVRYKNLFDKLPYPVIIIDVISLRPYSFNKAIYELLGYSSLEFMNMRFSAHMVEQDASQFRKNLDEIISKGGNEIELKLHTRDKLDVYLTGYVQSINMNDRQYVHILMHDVTELKRSTNELISSEVKYRSLFELASDAILVVDINTLNIIDANEVAIKFLGYRRDDLIKMALFDINAVDEQKKLQEHLNNLEIYNHTIYEQVIKNRKGKQLLVEINAHKVNYGNKEVYQFLIRDITARKETERALQLSEQRYREMFEGNQAIKLVIDMNKYVIDDANLAASGFYGYSQQEMRGMSLEKINILNKDKIVELIKQAREQKHPYYTVPQRLNNGDIRIVEIRDGAMEIEGKSLLYSIVHDVTASKQAQDKLLLATKMFDCTNDAVIITDKKNHIISVNQAFSEITGYQMSEILNNEPDIILAGRNQRLLSREVLEIIENNGQWQGDIWHRLKNGETRPLRATINVVSDDQGNMLNYIYMLSTATPVDTGVCYGAEHYTSLTGLPNKLIFTTQLRHAIERNQRTGKQLAIMRIDLLDFSNVNKQWGYEVGDQILRAIAKRLKHNVRETDSVAHFGGDDFVILLDDLTDIQQVGIVAQKILSTLGEEYQIDNNVIKLDVSIGIAITPDDGDDVDVLIEKSEFALRLAQQAGGNSFKLRSQKLNENAMQWMQIEMDLLEALKNDEFIAVYLPKIDLKQSVANSIEALIRWKTSIGIELPKKFLGFAEQAGLINEIGMKCIARAITDFSNLQKNCDHYNGITLNISAPQITNELEEFLFEQCEFAGVSAESITLDISEKDFHLCREDQRSILRDIQARGPKLCLDDFGRGGASLATLLEYTIDEIKLDRSLVSSCINSIETAKIIQSIIGLADKLNIKVTAEGIESVEEYEKLRDFGCRYMQGYYFTQPLLAEEIENFRPKIGL